MSLLITTPSTSTDTLPLRFHGNHGKNIRVSSDGTMARRTNTGFFTRGLLFSSRPVKVNEKVTFKLVEVAGDVGGFLYVGFTSRNPDTLPGATCASLANKPGYWSWFFPKNLCDRNAILFYYVTSGGEVRYGVDNAEKGSFGGKIQLRSPLWALIDIFGNSNAIKLVDLALKREPGLRYQPAPERFVPMMLHRTHGRNVRVSGSHAHRLDDQYEQGYVFTHRPLRVNETVAVQVSANQRGRFRGCLHLGVTSCDPGSLNRDELPDDAHLLVNRPEYWVLICDFTNLNAGDEISLSAAANGQIAFRLNGAKFGGVVHVDHTLPLWVFLSVCGSAQPISLFSCSEKIDEKKDKECVVCFDNSVDTALYRCGHTCMCYDCAIQQWQGKGHGHCPLCRAVIKDVIRINK